MAWLPACECTGHSNESLTVFALPSVTPELRIQALQFS